MKDKCPKCGNHSLCCGYGLAGDGIGAYFYCETEGCDYFDKTPDPELSTPEEMEAHRKKQEARAAMTDADVEIDALREHIEQRTTDESLFQWLLRQPAVKAQAYFWNYSSRSERRKAILADMRKEQR